MVCTIYAAKSKALISCTVIQHLFFEYAKSKFSHDVAYVKCRSCNSTIVILSSEQVKSDVKPVLHIATAQLAYAIENYKDWLSHNMTHNISCYLCLFIFI